MPDAERIAVVVGIGRTRFARRTRESEHALALRAILAALRDAGLAPADVDGVVRFDREPVWEFDLTAGLGVPHLDFYNAVPYGPGATPSLLRMAAMAIAQGLARVVVGYHARNRGARAVFGPGMADREGAEEALVGSEQFQLPFGCTGPAAPTALWFRRHMHRAGLSAQACEVVTTRLRDHAARNPRALARRPLTPAAWRRSRLVADPLRAVDVASDATGAGAFVVTSLARARDLRSTPVRVLGSLQVGLPSAARQLGLWLAADPLRTVRRASGALYRAARRRPRDVDVACLHDAASPLVLLALEAYGFCGVGESERFVRATRLARGPRVNPHGGQLGEASLDGINDLLEAVRQLRGDATWPVRGARTALVSGSLLEPTSAVLLGV